MATTFTPSDATDASNPFRHLPSVDKVLRHPLVRALETDNGLAHELVADVTRREIAAARKCVERGETAPTTEAVAEAVVVAAIDLTTPHLRAVVNATGVVLHTNLGRAPLSRQAAGAVAQVAAHYNNLEYELDDGGRGSRLTHISDLLARVTGAEAGIVVNNAAAAVLMVLTVFARGKEAILSRGQAVEIGGGFRIPDVMAQSGARLVEVGTTNKTYLRDYAGAITDSTAVLMRVHSSNFAIIGFTHSVDVTAMAQLADDQSRADRNILCIDDIGSGALLPTEAYGLAHEPMVQESVSAGAHLTLFSGDKLLGGPQCGLIVGRSQYIDRLKKHPLMRALRVDKMTLTALQMTLLHFLRGEAERTIPVWQMMAATPAELNTRAEAWHSRLAALPGVVDSVAPSRIRQSTLEPGEPLVVEVDEADPPTRPTRRSATPETQMGRVSIGVIDGQSTVGGGSLPGQTFPTRLLALDVAGAGGATACTAALRRCNPPIIARIERGLVLCDPRTVLPDQDADLLAGLSAVIKAIATQQERANIEMLS